LNRRPVCPMPRNTPCGPSGRHAGCVE